MLLTRSPVDEIPCLPTTNDCRVSPSSCTKWSTMEQTAREEDCVSCRICLEAMKEPKALPCVHRLCDSCLNNHIEVSKTPDADSLLGFSCPDCREFIPVLDTRSPPSVWTDAFIKRLTDLHPERQLQNNSERRVRHPCPEHADTEVDLYCVNCCEPICHLCAAAGHDECERMVTVKKAAQEHRSVLQNKISQIQPLIEKSLKREEVRQSCMQNVCEKFKSVEREVRECARKVQEFVDEQKELLLRELNQHQELLKQNVSADAFRLTECISMSQDLVKMATSKMMSSSDLDMCLDTSYIASLDLWSEKYLTINQEYDSLCNSISDVECRFEVSVPPCISLGKILYMSDFNDTNRSYDPTQSAPPTSEYTQKPISPSSGSHTPISTQEPFSHPSGPHAQTSTPEPTSPPSGSHTPISTPEPTSPSSGSHTPISTPEPTSPSSGSQTPISTQEPFSLPSGSHAQTSTPEPTSPPSGSHTPISTQEHFSHLSGSHAQTSTSEPTSPPFSQEPKSTASAPEPTLPPPCSQTQTSAPEPMSPPPGSHTQTSTPEPMSPPPGSQTQTSAPEPMSPPPGSQTQTSTPEPTSPPPGSHTQTSTPEPMSPPPGSHTQTSAPEPMSPPPGSQTQTSTPESMSPPPGSHAPIYTQEPMSPTSGSHTPIYTQEPILPQSGSNTQISIPKPMSSGSHTLMCTQESVTVSTHTSMMSSAASQSFLSTGNSMLLNQTKSLKHARCPDSETYCPTEQKKKKAS